jgi:multidrug efflux pump subunit AcrA (membrane-fusion protein)
MPGSVEATGIVTYDTRNIYTVSSRIAGRVERMHLKYEYQQVRKGQLIAEIYSPELTNAQRELVFLLVNDKDNNDLISAAKQKLRLLGVSTSEIDAIVSERSARDVTRVYSPYVGIVIATTADGNADSNTSDGSEPMGAMDTPSTKISSVSQAALVREGDYVDAGQTLVSIVDASSLLIELDITGEQAAVLKKGDQIQLDLGNGLNRNAKVEFVQPYFNQGENFAKVRIYTENKDLRIGQLVRARLDLQQPESLWVPREAVVSLGAKDIVFVKERDVFKPRAVVTGVRSKGQIEVLGGLATSDKIASSASFMVDSDSFIKLQE